MTLLSTLSASLDHFSLFAPGQDFFWQNAIFDKSRWEPFTKGTRVFLTIATALLLMYEMRAARLRERISKKTKRWVAITLTVVAFFTYFDFFNPNVRYSEYYHRHEFYHYYLGSKYFKEIGYTELYECTAVAEVELGRGAQVAKRDLRDLHVNLIKPMKDTYVLDHPEKCKNKFSAARWEDWKKDVDWFYHSSVGSYWDNMQKDHGYNPPPVWGMTGKLFASIAPAGDTFFKLLSMIDVAFHVGVVLLFYWAFGFRIMAVATVFWGCNAPANFYWTGGAVLRQGWIFLAIAAVCLARKRKFALSGAALTWSSLLRVFPVVMFGGVALIMLFTLIRTRRFARDQLRFVAGAALAGAILIPASIAATEPNAYQAFAAHIGLHKDTPLTNHMGLETMLVHNWDGRMVFSRDDRLDDPFEAWKSGRTERKQHLRPVFLVLNLALLAWLAWALHR